jgi:3-oxoacyl-[acyl-carrier-protein] synthase-1
MVARIPSHWTLRRTPCGWLVNMAARAVKEIVARHALIPAESALILVPPERFRHSAFLDVESMSELARLVVLKTGMPFQSSFQVSGGGAAAIASALDLAVRYLEGGDGTHVILGGVDSYVLEGEYARLDAAGRLRTEGTAQGFTPGEGAVFVLLSKNRPSEAQASLAILGWADAKEPHSAISDQYSQGRAMLAALRATAQRAATAEPAIDWVVSNANGERYAAWESTLAQARFYRTRRERLLTTYPAMSVGETGSASGALTLVVAAHGLSGGYRPATIAMIELSSEGEGRTACLVKAVSSRIRV